MLMIGRDATLDRLQRALAVVSVDRRSATATRQPNDWHFLTSLRLVHCASRSLQWFHTGWSKKLAPFLCALTSPNINRSSKLFHCQNQEEICNSTCTITKDPTTPQVCHYPTLWNVCILPLVSGVAGLSASSSSKADTLNIWCKNCRVVTVTVDNNCMRQETRCFLLLIS